MLNKRKHRWNIDQKILVILAVMFGLLSFCLNAQSTEGMNTTQALYPPTNLSGELIYNTVSLTWEAPISDANLLGYRIYRNEIAITSIINSLVYFDVEIENQNLYIYHVVAVYPTGVSEYSNLVEITVIYPPNNLTFGFSGNNIILNWEAPLTIHGESEVFSTQQYRVYRDGVLISMEQIYELTFTDVNVANGIYIYGVSAVYSLGESIPVTVSVKSVNPILEIHPMSKVFNNTAIFLSSEPQAFTITNIGGGNTTIESINLSGTDIYHF